MRKLLLSCFAVIAAFSAKAQQHQHVTPIDSVQYVLPADLAANKDASAYFKLGDTITIEGIVTFDPGYYGLSSNRKGAWLQTAAGSEWEGMHVMVDATALKNKTGINKTLTELLADIKFYDNFIPGLKVKVTGILDEFQGYTQLLLLPVESEITDLTPNPVSPRIMAVSKFMAVNQMGDQVRQLETGEPYENIYVEFKNVSVVDVQQSGSRWFWSVQDENGNKIGIRDASGYFRSDANTAKLPAGYTFTPPSIGTKLNYIRGIIFQADNAGINQYFIAPLSPNDIDIQYIAPTVSKVWRNPSIASSTDAVTVYAHITDDKDSVMSATLYYAIGSATATPQSVNMTKGSNNIWLAQIPAQNNNTIVFYWVKATDNNNQNIYAPDSFKTGFRYMVINGGINKIIQIQEDPFKTGNSIWNRDTLTGLNLRVVVTSAINEYDLGLLSVQDGTTPFSGITIKGTSNVTLADLKRGDSLLITGGVVREDFNVTILENTTITKLSSGNTIPAPVKNVNIDSVMKGNYNYAEAYESMLIEYEDIYVVDTNADHSTNRYFGEWAIGYDTTTYTGLRVDDISMDIPDNFARDSLTIDEKLGYIRGILTYSFGNWKLLPRNKSDIEGFTTKEPVSVKENAKNEASFKIYPNPASNYIYIAPEKYLGNANLQIIDMQGKVFFEQTIYAGGQNIHIPLNNFSDGLYMVKISDNVSVYVQKLLIQK